MDHREIELHGQVIPSDSKVLLITGSAGRDERTFPDADRFDIHRKMDHHLSFGYGIHFCLGAALARLEGASPWRRPSAASRNGPSIWKKRSPPHQHREGYTKLPISV